MRVGLLIITHGDVGKALFDAAREIIGSVPLPTRVLSVSSTSTPEEMKRDAIAMISEMENGDGILVLTDIYGSTPSNVACAQQDKRVAVVAGLNLPMLIRVLNYPQLQLRELVEKAVSGGRDGVVICQRKNS